MRKETSSTQIDAELSLGLENPELLPSASELDISVTEVINPITGETSAGPSGAQTGQMIVHPQRLNLSLGLHLRTSLTGTDAKENV